MRIGPARTRFLERGIVVGGGKVEHRGPVA